MNLADPELELIDPTPNIHSLFVHFDEMFFWTKLMGRAIVRWSKKMYSCAGICSYEGRNGLCDIALSEPLLKLRPRKDLVETLLHEMIHAFLFITNRDSDRDGHGPNFQAHMHRINRAAGLNISIYHDFHDEVKLYLRHWWRCNGRCQTMKPHFGLVKRSCNKAPGPKEYWWSQHQKMCGGTFIKIKEPEKVQKPKKTVKAKAKGDITKFINNNTGNAVNKNVTTNKNVNNENKTKNIATVEPKSKADDIKKLIDLGRQRTNSLSVIENVRNIWAAKQPQSQPVENTVAETVRHVWTSKQLPNVPGASTKKNTATNWKKNKSHTVQIDSPPKKVMKIDDYFKYKASTILQQVYGQEFIISQSSNSPTLKAIPKADSVTIPPVNVFVNCPNCNKQVYSNDINIHLDECLNKEIIEELSKDFTDPSTVKKEVTSIKMPRNEKDNKNGLKTIVGTIQAIPYKFIPDIKPKIENLERIIKTQSIDWNTKLNTATSAHHGHVKPSTSKESIIQKCPGCGIKIDIPLEEHLKECFRFFELNSTIPKEGISDLETVVIHDEFNPLKVKSEPGTSKPEEVQKCPICGIKIEKPIEEHLDECLSIFDNDTTIPTEGASIIETIVIDDDDEDDIFDETQTFNATGTKSPCPCCLKMIEVAEMNAHLNDCLSA